VKGILCGINEMLHVLYILYVMIWTEVCIKDLH